LAILVTEGFEKYPDAAQSVLGLAAEFVAILTGERQGLPRFLPKIGFEDIMGEIVVDQEVLSLTELARLPSREELPGRLLKAVNSLLNLQLLKLARAQVQVCVQIHSLSAE
jgi:hypothetical protein